MKPGNTLTLMTALAVGLVSYASREARAQTWDVFNETYGSGAGEVSFNANYTYMWGPPALTETLSPGKATLSLDAGSGPHYPMKDPTLPAYAGGGADVTLEWKIAFKDGASGTIYLADNQSSAAYTWGHILLFNRNYDGNYVANEIEDYYAHNVSLAPPGFDGSLPHVYRIVRQSGVDSWYVDGQLVKQTLVSSAAAAADGCRLEWGFNENASSASSVDVYYFRAASGAFLPPDTTPPTLLSASRGAGDPTQVSVTFSEAVQTRTVTNLGNYSVNFGGPVLAATRTGPANVTLTLASGLVGTVTNILTVNGVQDLASNSIAPNSQVTISVPASGWDVMNENYGNGSGEVSFNASYTYAWGSTAPDETLSSGMATLDLHQGSGTKYPVKSAAQPAWAGGGADVTVEWKCAFHGGASANLFLAENQTAGLSSWGHILSFNWDYVTGVYEANSIEDYYTRDGVSVAPPGFDSSLPHVYRLVRQAGVNSWYLDGQLLKQPVVGPGAAGDALRLNWGFYENINSPSAVDVYYLKAANVALIPGPTDTTPPAAISAARGNMDYTKVTVVYSEPVQAGTAINPSRYSINHGGPVLAASEINSTTFILTLTSGLADTVVNTLTINGVKDLAGNSIAANTQVTVTNPPQWDVMNEKYGSGPGEVPFNANYTYAFGSTAPPETLSAGKATLSLDPGSAVKYPVKSANVPAWAGGGADVTLEWKLAFLNGSGGHIYLAENQSGALSSWGHILSFNNDYNTGVYEANSLEDYLTRDGMSVAPPGFDGSLPHVYRIVRKAGTNSWFLDGKLLKQALVVGGGAAGDGLRFEWGFNLNAETPSSVEVYYLRIANGALLPEVTLHFTRNGNQLTFSWDAAGYALQENSILTNAAGWTNTPGGSVSGVSVTMGAGNKYFRLKQQ